MTAPEAFDPAEFAAIAPELAVKLRWLEETDSTNDEAARLGKAGAEAGTIVGAERQRAGRGRRGAAWYSGQGEGLAFSVVLRPDFPRALWPRLALAAGLAVSRAVERTGVLSSIKWPNDVLAGDRKLAGILVEGAADFAVVGIGLNVNGTAFPPELEDLATSLERETGRRWEREWALAEAVRGLLAAADQCGRDFSAVIDAVRSRCALTGHRVSCRVGEEVRQGEVVGLGDAGELLLRENGGVVKLVQADEVRLR